MSYLVKYTAEVLPSLRKRIGRDNIHSLPKLEKIVVNVGMGTWLNGGKDYSSIVQGVEAITGQKSVVKRSRMSVSNFRLRKGMPVGVMVTLRGKRMYDFFERVIAISAPRIRDFTGFLKRSFDGKGNYSFGIKDYSVFPEIHYNDVVKNYGVQITVKTTAKNDEEARMLLEEFGFPFQK